MNMCKHVTPVAYTTAALFNSACFTNFCKRVEILDMYTWRTYVAKGLAYLFKTESVNGAFKLMFSFIRCLALLELGLESEATEDFIFPWK